MESASQKNIANAGANSIEGDRSRSRSRVGVTTGQMAIGTPSYTFKSKLNLTGLAAKTDASNAGGPL